MDFRKAVRFLTLVIVSFFRDVIYGRMGLEVLIGAEEGVRVVL